MPSDRKMQKEVVANRKARHNREWRNKVITPDRLALKAMLWRQAGWEVVLTCGCFDLLHVGHFRLLRDAAAQGNLLVVGINSDRSVRALKGPDRPMIPQQERAEALASLSCVDAVTIFDEDNPIQLIQSIQPRVFCKGGDYKLKDLIEAEAVKNCDGRVLILPFTRGHSSTSLIDKLAGFGDA